MTSDAVRELEEKNEALRTRIVTAHAERDSALALVHARTVNLDAMRTDRDAAVKRADEAEAKLLGVRVSAERDCQGLEARLLDSGDRLAAAQAGLDSIAAMRSGSLIYDSVLAQARTVASDARNGGRAALDAALARAREEGAIPVRSLVAAYVRLRKSMSTTDVMPLAPSVDATLKMRLNARALYDADEIFDDTIAALPTRSKP